MVVDFHTHIFPEWLRSQRERYVQRDQTFGLLYANTKAKLATADDLVLAMDEDGVDVAVVMGIGWTDFGLARDTNDYLIESVLRYPKRIVGFAGVSPAWGDECVREADRCARAGLLGVGELHPDSQEFDMGDKRTMAPLMEVVQQHGMIFATHSSEPVGHLYQGKGSTTPGVLWALVQNFPDVTIVCAHWGGGLPFYALMPEVASSLANVYFDTAASPFLYDANIFATVTSLVGADRILLGSDYPLLRARRLMSEIRGSSMTEEEQAAVLGGNGEKLLKLDGHD